MVNDLCSNAPGTSLAIDLSSVTEGAYIVAATSRRLKMIDHFNPS